MKKSLRHCAVAAAIAAVLSVSFAAAAAAPDFMIGNNNFHETGVYGKDGYFGPWYQDGCVSYQSGTLVLDASVDNAWVTMNLTNDTLNAADYKYMIVKLKTDNPSTAKGFTMTIGKKPKGSRNVNNGQDYTAWTLAGGGNPPALTTNYTTIAVDLAKSGTTTFSGDPDFALNKGTAGNAKIYLSELYLTNTLPSGLTTGGGATGATSAPADSSKTSSNTASSTAAASSQVSSQTQAPSSEETSSSQAVSSAVSSETTSTPAVSTTPAKHPVSLAVILIVIVAVLAAGTIAAIVVIGSRKNKSN